MVQNNKVLTVSYGTFSCTLEGFEDSFDTMKAIAEYFRDLASDDRYFGAEPPQPDAEMLTRIAQRDIARQVEARTSDGAVHLRATGPTPAPVPDAAVIPAPVAPPATATETAAQPVVEQPVVEQPVVEQPVVEPIAEVAKSEVVDVAPQTPIETAPVTATAAAVIEAPVDLAAIAAAVAAPETAELPPVEDLVATEVDAPRTEIGDDTIPAADSIAAKLQRIRAVVAQAPREEEFSEDEHAEIFITESAVDIAAAMRVDEEAQLVEDEDNQEQVEIAEALERIDQRLTGSVADQPEGEAESEAAAEPEAEAEVEAEVEVEVEVEAEVEVEVETLTEPEVTEEIEVEAEVEAGDEAISEPVEPLADDSSLFDGLEDPSGTGEADIRDQEANILAQVAKQAEISTSEPESAPPTPARRARIVRVKRADIERAVASGALEEIEEDEPQAGLDSSLSDADEADLLRELAAVEAELLATDKTEDPQAPEAAETEIELETEAAPAAVTRTAAETPDRDVSRLMAAADEKLEDPAAASSRETYGHLRAAMASAQAERAAGGSAGSELRDDEYREDLASVVRPRRPAAAKTVSRRPETVQRPAPLKLVAEQRIDEAPKQKRGPVRPRRIASAQADEAEFADKGRKGGFAEYAVESGAVELNELLEAAASYMSFIEGRDHFSRPQLMNKVKLLDSAEFNREDGLRSFGLLLREGKIEKTHNGQFTASGQIGFRPGQRAAS
ncbi:chemotaxis protein CheA [Parasedimentitalea psychrophila]|uniref:Chemotaxis protein CheA n=1 Tax=Parasedimentitalea psychrophila TaxID=2997337 RepID=A0A9Y2KYL7_9RHOB|nr:chemotaxis protein CheA [Parasedimentitalea psychrophila]WIY23554.1 chemotaxis protein CheA [Parasedimentitalea psychrophila]